MNGEAGVVHSHPAITTLHCTAVVVPGEVADIACIVPSRDIHPQVDSITNTKAPSLGVFSED